MALDIVSRCNIKNKRKSLFIKVCNILQEFVLSNEEKIAIMNNKDFLNAFIDNLNFIISDQDLKTLPKKLRFFLIGYGKKFIEYGLDIEMLNLTRLYELHFNSLGIKSGQQTMMNMPS